jgi:hypothetical protein
MIKIRKIWALSAVKVFHYSPLGAGKHNKNDWIAAIAIRAASNSTRPEFDSA